MISHELRVQDDAASVENSDSTRAKTGNADRSSGRFSVEQFLDLDLENVYRLFPPCLNLSKAGAEDQGLNFNLSNLDSTCDNLKIRKSHA
jgi:hypothetical protein